MVWPAGYAVLGVIGVIGEEEEIPIRNPKGTWCVFAAVFCQEGFCDECDLAIEGKISRDRVIREVNEILFKADKART